MGAIYLSDKDIDALNRVVATEIDHRLAFDHPEEYAAQIHGVVDTILNRVASGRWGDTVAEVANAKNQFSAINGPKNSKYTVYGSVDKVPDSVVKEPMKAVVSSWLRERATGTPSSVGGGLHYANPLFSDASNMGWINELDGPKLGYGKSTHVHGTAAGSKPVEAKVAIGPEGGVLPAEMSPILAGSRSAQRSDYSYLPMPGAEKQVRTPNPATVAASGAANVNATPRSANADPLGVGEAGMSATPNLETGAGNQPIPSSTYADARRSLFNAQPIDATGLGADTMNRGGSFSPNTLPNLPDGMVTQPNPKPFVSQVAGRPDVMPSNGARPVTNGVRPAGDAAGMPAAQSVAPIPATMSPALAAARQRLDAARVSKASEAAPVPMPRDARPKTGPVITPGTAEPETIVVGGKTIAYPPGGLTKIGDTVYKIVPNGDGTGKVVKMSEINAQNGLAGIENLGDKSMAGGVANQVVGAGLKAGVDQVAANAPAIAADLGNKATELAGNFGNTVGGLFGNLFGGKPATAAPKPFESQIAVRPEVIPSNTAKKTTAGASLSAPGAGLTAAQKNALTALPAVMGEDSGAFRTGQGKAGTVAMPLDVRPVLNRPLPATLSAPGAGLSAAQKNAMTSLNGASLNPTVTKGAALMGAGAVGGVVGAPPIPASPITRTAAPTLQPTVRVSSQPVAQPSVYQSGGYLYSKSGDGYVKVGKIGGTLPSRSSSSSSSSSSGGGSDYFRSVTDPMYNGG